MNNLPPSELAVWLGTIFSAVLIGLAAFGNYLRSNKLTGTNKAVDSVVTSIGIGYGDRDQIERAIAQITRIASAMETLADKRTDKIEQALERLSEEERRERERQREDWERRRYTEPEEEPRRPR